MVVGSCGSPSGEFGGGPGHGGSFVAAGAVEQRSMLCMATNMSGDTRGFAGFLWICGKKTRLGQFHLHCLLHLPAIRLAAHNPGNCGNQPHLPQKMGWHTPRHLMATMGSWHGIHVSSQEAAMSPHLLLTVGFAAHAAGMLR